MKVFMGGDFEVFLRTCKAAFQEVRVVRPEASIARRSKEVYLVCHRPRRIQESSVPSGSYAPDGQGA